MPRKNKRAKACDIPAKVKKIVFKRDNGCCVLCGHNNAMPNAHVISRARGGLGVEENIVCLGTNFSCGCHFKYDCSSKKEKDAMYRKIVKYLKIFYPQWKKENMIYKK